MHSDSETISWIILGKNNYTTLSFTREYYYVVGYNAAYSSSLLVSTSPC